MSSKGGNSLETDEEDTARFEKKKGKLMRDDSENSLLDMAHAGLTLEGAQDSFMSNNPETFSKQPRSNEKYNLPVASYRKN